MKMKFDLEMSHLFCVFIYLHHIIFTSASIPLCVQLKELGGNQVLAKRFPLNLDKSDELPPWKNILPSREDWVNQSPQRGLTINKLCLMLPLMFICSPACESVVGKKWLQSGGWSPYLPVILGPQSSLHLG